MSNDGSETITIHITADLLGRVAQASLAEGCSISVLISRALEAHLDAAVPAATTPRRVATFRRNGPRDPHVGRF